VIVLEVLNVYKRFGDIEVLKGVSFKVKPGEFVAIFGPSGSGKTTLLNILATILRPDRGEILIDDRSIVRASEDFLTALRYDYIGYVYQSCKMINSLNLLDNITLPLMIRGVSKSDRIRVAIELAEKLGLSDRLKNYPSQLSFGERKRALIGMVLCKEPRLVLVDEPTANLDELNSRRVLELLDNFRQSHNSMLIVATHDNLVKEYATKIYTLTNGKLGDYTRTNEGVY
jgi:ABC-type lipoprotein export system ATPase subunit